MAAEWAARAARAQASARATAAAAPAAALARKPVPLAVCEDALALHVFVCAISLDGF